MHSLYREIALEERVYLSGLSEKDPLDKVVSAPTMMNSMELRDSKSEDQSEVNGMSKGSGSNAPCKAHVSQQLELLPSAPTRDIASRRCSIFVSLPSSIGPRSTTHAHLIRSKSGNGTMLCQIEIVARNEPSLILSCPSTAHRDSILKFLAERNMSHGWENAATLSVEKAEENDASIGARWILPIKFNNSNSAIFGAVEQSFQTSGMIPVRDITEDTDATGIKRGFLVIHASSETWLKKYAMTPNGHKALVLRVEYTVSRECRICQTLLPEHDSRLPASTSNPAVKVVQDHEATSRISLHPQLHDIQGATRSTELRTNTALEVESIPKKSGVQPTGIAVVHGPWKLPAVQSGTLSGVTISKFVADLVELNGEERSCSATGQEIVTAFNDYIDINYPESSYKEKVKALRRKCHEVVATSFHPNLPALQKYRHMMRGEMPCAELPSAITVPLELKDTGEGSQHMDPLAGHSIRRRIKYRTIKNGDGLDPATPGILMSSGDMTPGVESRGCRAANEASQQPESHPRTHGRQEAKGREPSNERGAKVTSRRRRRPRAKSEVHECVMTLWAFANNSQITCFSENSVTPGGDAHDNAMRKSQKTTHSQNPSILVARNGVDMTSKGIRAGDLEEADKFLSEVGKELEAKAARKIRFSSHSE